MNIEDVLEKLSKFKKIYVTGPQRSGTTFAAKYLAKKLKYHHIDEHNFGTHDFVRMKQQVNLSKKFVIQCPAQSHNILDFPGDEETIIVFMIRDIYDIITSEHRIDWHKRGAEGRERQKYQTKFPKYTKSYIPISVIKYKVWDEMQKPFLQNYLELPYEILSETDMWIDKKDRVNFKNKQIS